MSGARTNSVGTNYISVSGADSFYFRCVVGFSAPSSAVDEYNFRIGADDAAGYTIGANGFGFAYDRGNQLGALNAAGTQNIILYSRKASVNVAVDSGIAVSSTPSEMLLELFFNGSHLLGYINGTQVAPSTPIDTADVPTGQFIGFSCLNKTAGTTARTVYMISPFGSVRYSAAS